MELQTLYTVFRSADPERFLTRAAGVALLKRASSFAKGGGITWLSLESRWSSNLRCARNEIISNGDVRNNHIRIRRTIRGGTGDVLINRTDDASIQQGVHHAERYASHQDVKHEDSPDTLPPEKYSEPKIWSDSTYNLDATQRAKVLEDILPIVKREGMLLSCYIQVGAYGRTVLDSEGLAMYYPYTTAQFSITVRDPAGTASGWAGVDWSDWTKIDTKALSEIALDKCLRSRNRSAVEPGRYTTILEAQAVADFFQSAADFWVDRDHAEQEQGPYSIPGKKGFSKIGQKLIDDRITVTADPSDPLLGFVPFDLEGAAYQPDTTWFKNGVLKDLVYNRKWGIRLMGKDTGLPSSGAYHMSGGTTSLEEMISTTRRGIYVTRFSGVSVIHHDSLMSVGYTRDGTWLIENGKISKPIKNFRFSDSPLFALNRIEQLGVPQRVFHPQAPVAVPAIKVRDFNFTQLSDAV